MVVVALSLATAALIIASGVLGRHPTPPRSPHGCEATARKLGSGGGERLYGAGLIKRGGCDRASRLTGRGQ